MARRFEVRDGDEVVAFGTAQECAEKLGISPATVRFYASPAHHRRRGGIAGSRMAYVVDGSHDLHDSRRRGDRTAVVCRYCGRKRSALIVSNDNPSRCPFCGIGFAPEEES